MIQRTQLLLLATMLGDYDYDSTNTIVTSSYNVRRL